VRHHAWRYLLGVTRIGHPLVPIRWLVVLAVHYWGCVLCISPVTHRSRNRPWLAGAVFLCKWVGSRRSHSIVGVSFPVRHGLQVAYGRKNRARASRSMIAKPHR
jgi:hypothetical protein